MSHPLLFLRPAGAQAGASRLLRLLGFLFLLTTLPYHAWAAFGIFQDYAIVNANGTGNVYYAGGANADNAPNSFQNHLFGSFTASQTLVLGSEIKTFKNGGTNVTGARLYYRVYLTSGTAGGFIPTNPAFSDNLNGSGDQKWTNVANSQGNNTPTPVNLLAGLATGDYTLEVYWTAQADNSSDVTENNFGANYKAYFSYTAAPLPVTLTAFTAQRQGTNALLSWSTANETNNAGYEVQVSPSGNLQDFRPLGFVTPALATSQATHTYTFQDTEANKAGLRYYRLRQVDLDGSRTYSPVRTVQFDALASTSLVAAPNPFSGSLALRLELPQASLTTTLTLTDALGRVVLHQDLGALPAGANQATLAEASSLPTGVYVARLVLATGTQLTKVVKE